MSGTFPRLRPRGRWSACLKPGGKLDAAGALIKTKDLIDGGIIQPIVYAVFPLAQARRAFERGIGGHARGKLVLSVQPG